jgi:hypothetical protein
MKYPTILILLHVYSLLWDHVYQLLPSNDRGGYRHRQQGDLIPQLYFFKQGKKAKKIQWWVNYFLWHRLVHMELHWLAHGRHLIQTLSWPRFLVGFLQSLHPNAKEVPCLGHECFLTNPFQSNGASIITLSLNNTHKKLSLCTSTGTWFFFCGLCYNGISTYSVECEDHRWTIHWKDLEGNFSLIEVLSFHFSGETKENHKKICQDPRWPSQDPNWGPPRYESGAFAIAGVRYIKT